MKSIRYYVCSCLSCNKLAVVKQEFLDFNSDCCLDMKNLKILKQFNDEQEATNYAKLLGKE